ncbi:hypothetical protein GCM10023069_32670 [Shinella granuli]
MLLSGFVSGLAALAERLEIRLAGGAWIEALVLAILLGAACRLLLRRPAVFDPGIAFSAKYFLEIAIVLLGAGVSATAIAGMGWPLIGAIAAVVGVVLLASYAIGRGLGLSRTVALLVACGNSICGNSVIAATAPVIRADAEDVASSIAFTAVLGMVTVLLLPVLVPLLGLSATGYGVMAGMTVYAVPQVLAATAPVSALSIQIGTFVKLVRVLMLGPVIFLLSLAAGKESGPSPGAAPAGAVVHPRLPRHARRAQLRRDRCGACRRHGARRDRGDDPLHGRPRPRHRPQARDAGRSAGDGRGRPVARRAGRRELRDGRASEPRDGLGKLRPRFPARLQAHS